jgi:hypothetical protein
MSVDKAKMYAALMNLQNSAGKRAKKPSAPASGGGVSKSGKPYGPQAVSTAEKVGQILRNAPKR